MTFWEGTATFVGIPALVLLLVALPIFGSTWWDRLRRRPGARRRVEDATDS